MVIKHPKSLGTRCREAWTRCSSSCCCIFGIVIGLSFCFLVFGLMWVIFYCQEQPSISLDSFSVRNMTLYQNSTIPPTQSPWQVDSGFTVTLLTSNPNSVAKCFCTLRRVYVRMEYRGQLILQQEVGLGFGLKPGASRPVTVEVKGEGFQLKNPDLGPFMQNDLRNGAMYFDIYFATRYMRNDRKAGWVNMGCLVQAQTPNSTQVGTLLYQDCVGL